METAQKIMILEQCQISPPPDSVPQTSLPLTFFDISRLHVPSTECLYFYEVHCSKNEFMHSILPGLKSSLSLSLQYFFPLAGHLVWSPYCTAPELLYVVGDSVSFTVAESSFNFNDLCSNYPRKIRDFDQLVSQLQKSATIVPLFAVQVTIFPNLGICIGINISHVATDGMSSNHFMKFWASVCKLGGETKIVSLLSQSLPSFDRTKINSPNGIEISYLNDLKMMGISQQSFGAVRTAKVPSNKFVATFIVDKPTTEKLKKWILGQKEGISFNLTTFVATCACIWASLINALGGNNSREHLVVPIECRSRLDPALPVTYFGNCIVLRLATISKSDSVGKNGISIAAEVIGKAIKVSNESNGVLNGFEDYFATRKSVASERTTRVVGSPRLGVYDIDFGWGKPKKVEIISATAAGDISICERGDGEAGLEIGIALEIMEMNVFTSIFETYTNLP